MKLRNKKTGEIPEKIETISYIQWSEKIMMVYTNNDGERIMQQYDTLDAFNEEWEEYEDEHLYVISCETHEGYECVLKSDFPEMCSKAKELGIGFETEKECQEAVEKLKAWKRLKNKGFKITQWRVPKDGAARVEILGNCAPGIVDELDLLFGGEDA